MRQQNESLPPEFCKNIFDVGYPHAILPPVIASFRSKGLETFWQRGSKAGIDPRLADRISRRLVALQAATRPEDMHLPGFDFHELQGDRSGTYSVHVNGPWCITFGWRDGNAIDVDLENYH
jgi:proteic killer suppression protein